MKDLNLNKENQRVIKMKVQLIHNSTRLDSYIKKMIDRKVHKLENRIRQSHPEAAHFIIRFDFEKKTILYQCCLELRLICKNVLIAKKVGYDLPSAFQESFKALLKEYEKFRLKIYKSMRPKRIFLSMSELKKLNIN